MAAASAGRRPAKRVRRASKKVLEQEESEGEEEGGEGARRRLSFSGRSTKTPARYTDGSGCGAVLVCVCACPVPCRTVIALSHPQAPWRPKRACQEFFLLLTDLLHQLEPSHFPIFLPGAIMPNKPSFFQFPPSQAPRRPRGAQRCAKNHHCHTTTLNPFFSCFPPIFPLPGAKASKRGAKSAKGGDDGDVVGEPFVIVGEEGGDEKFFHLVQKLKRPAGKRGHVMLRCVRLYGTFYTHVFYYRPV